MNNQQREFGRLALRVITRLMKLAGTVEWIAEAVQWGRPIPDFAVDEFYRRLHDLQDTMDLLRRTPQWRSVDVEDFDE